MKKNMHDVSKMKKSLAYGAARGMGAFRARPKKKTAPVQENPEKKEEK